MANPFADLETFLVNATGMDALLAGVILALSFTIPLIVMFTFILDPKGNDSAPAIFTGSVLGIVFSTVVGWLDLWVVVFIIFTVVFIWIDPLGIRGKASDG